MGSIKPLGSEKLNATDKIKRIIELSNYGYTNQPITESFNGAEVIIECATGGVYGIVKEKNDYYVKRGVNESKLDYIGGMFMKNKNRFSSYAEAFKRLELLKGQEELSEATKYVLKTNKPTPTPEPAIETPPMGPEMDATTPNTMDTMQPETADSEEQPQSKPSDYMAEIQKFSGKLGQELRDQRDNLQSDDLKYVLNMIISAVDLNTIDDEDLEDIASKFERERIEDDADANDEFVSDTEEDLSEVSDSPIDTLERFTRTNFGDKAKKTRSVDLSKYADLGEGEEDDIQEIDLDSIKNDISDSIGKTLSKYFK